LNAPLAKSSNDTGTLTRTAVVNAALRLMDEHGVDWLSMRKLATELGVSAQALYWYFPSKDALCRAVVASVGEELGALPLGTGAPIKQLERYLRGLRDHWRAHPSVIALGRRYPPTAAGDVAAQGRALLEQIGFEGHRAVERLRAVVWVVLGFVYVEHGVTESVHHVRVDGTAHRYLVHVTAADDGEDHELDTDDLFNVVLRTTLAGLLAEVAG
jgi:AcrR family transcriptional regulator